MDSITTPQIIILSVVLVLLIPILLHFIGGYRPAAHSTPTFLLAGPQNAGKTSLLTSFQNGVPSETQTSSTHLTISLALPISSDDAATATTVVLTDTPGHPKLRSNFLDRASETTLPLHGVLFLIDSASLSTQASLFDTVTYLYTTLLTLQQRCIATTGSLAAAKASTIPILIACNKSDLFTALPATKISKLLETEIEKMRESRAKGLVDVAQGEGEDAAEVLGEEGDGAFTWAMMEEFGITISVKGGSVKDGKTKDWIEWIEQAVESI